MTDQHDIKLGLQDNTEVLQRISSRLAVRFVGIFAAETVERYVFESDAALAPDSQSHRLSARLRRALCQ